MLCDGLCKSESFYRKEEQISREVGIVSWKRTYIEIFDLLREKIAELKRATTVLLSAKITFSNNRLIPVQRKIRDF